MCMEYTSLKKDVSLVLGTSGINPKKGGPVMRRKVFLLALLVLCIVTMALVGPMPGPSTATAARPIVIGVPTSLYTPFGREGLKAVKLAVEEINAKGGVKVGSENRPLKVAVADTRGGEPGTPVHDALMAIEKLITEKRPDAIVIGPFRSEVLMASMDLVAKYRVPQLGTIAQTPKFQFKIKKDPEKYKYLFRVTTDALVDATYLNNTFDILKNGYGLKNVYFLYQDTLWAKAFSGLMAKHCKKTGWNQVGFEGYAAGATDFSPALTTAKEKKADVIGMVWDVPLGAGMFAKQYEAMRVPSLLVGFVPPMASPAAVETVGPGVEYHIAIEFPIGASLPLKKWPKSGEFLSKFKKKYGALPEAAAVNSSAYDAVFILANAIEKAGSVDPDALVKALEQTDYTGASGRIRFNAQHIAIFGQENPNKTGMCVIFQWQKGKDGKLRRVPVYPSSLAEGKILLPPTMKK
ncbi:MAG TPA: amino acid ABC transporter substrate-binding protein [Desulfobacterales bacterium]|nr:amino acid ABC transporter substrate-binding protein [Desulfobacterales bacterium]